MKVAEGNGHSVIWARLEGVDREYQRLEEQRDEAIRERDEARAALKPLLEQVDGLRTLIVGQLPKGEAAKPGRKRISNELVADWWARNQAGESLSQIAAKDGVHQDTIKNALIGQGHAPKLQRRGASSAPRCKECGLPFDSPALTTGNVPEPVDGVCGLCQFIAKDLAEKRAAR